jgi:hypothetical protein
VDHLAEEVHVARRIFFERFIADFDSILDTITKTEVTGQVEVHRAEV